LATHLASEIGRFARSLGSALLARGISWESEYETTMGKVISWVFGTMVVGCLNP
jgi:hypothetical protein